MCSIRHLFAVVALAATAMAVGPLVAADSTSVIIRAVPWQKPHARLADQATTADTADTATTALQAENALRLGGYTQNWIRNNATGGSVDSATNATTASTASNLSGISNCAAGYALTRIGGNFICVSTGGDYRLTDCNSYDSAPGACALVCPAGYSLMAQTSVSCHSTWCHIGLCSRG